MFYIKARPNSYKRDEVDKDEGISDEEDIAELKLQLELNEQVSMLPVIANKINETSPHENFTTVYHITKHNVGKAPSLEKPVKAHDT